MVRVTIYLTELQVEALRDKARAEGTTRSELVRRGIDLILHSGSVAAHVKPKNCQKNLE